MSSNTWPVVLDDTDPSIQYSGQGWFQDSGSQDGSGNFGTSYLRTRHGTKNNDSLALSFKGTSVQLWGTTDLSQIPIVNGTGSGQTWDPKWECFVDGSSVGSTTPFPYTENNWLLCQGTQLSGGDHTLTVKVTTMGRTFWVDQLRFTPSSGASYGSGTVLFVSRTDSTLEYGSGWADLGDSAKMTTTSGSQLTFSFTGTSVSWFGYVPTELPHAASSAQYSIDGGSPVTFNLDGLSSSQTSTEYNRLFFTTPSLSSGQHTLVVTYLGSSSVTPLVLTNLYVTGTPSASSSSSSQSGSTNGGGGSGGSGGSNSNSSSGGISSGSGSSPTSNARSTTALGSKPSSATGSASNSSSGLYSPTGNNSTGIGSGSGSGSSSPQHLGSILGGVVGGLSVIGLSFFALILFLAYRRKKRLEASSAKDMREASAHAYSYDHPSLMRPDSISVASSSDPGFAGVGGSGNASGGGSGGIPISPIGVGYGWRGDSRDSLHPIRKGQQQGIRHGFGEGGSEGQVRHHEDSGLRIGTSVAPLTDVPPVYTPI